LTCGDTADTLVGYLHKGLACDDADLRPRWSRA